ncbi:MAG: hypothetical protein WBP38_05660 [Hyphomicrobium sp.]
MNQDVANRVIRRLVVAYGDPQIEYPDELFEEFSKALAGTRGDILTKGLDTVIKERVFPGWPTVGEVVKACREASEALAERYAPEQPKYSRNEPVSPTVAKALLEGFARTTSAGNAFADIVARCPRTQGSTIDVSAFWGNEVCDPEGNIVPIRKRREAA